MRRSQISDIAIENNVLNEVITIQEAAAIWNKEESTLRRVLGGPRFVEGKDYRKAGKVWLISRSAMERVYGKVDPG